MLTSVPGGRDADGPDALGIAITVGPWGLGSFDGENYMLSFPAAGHGAKRYHVKTGRFSAGCRTVRPTKRTDPRGKASGRAPSAVHSAAER